jgi:aspartate racemase
VRIPGIVGGIGPESTIDYYRRIIAGCQARRPHQPAPHLVINSISPQTLLRLAGANDRDGLVNYLLPALDVLANAGAEFAAFASNTPHLVFDLLNRRSPLPLISIVDVARSAAVDRGMKRLGLFGTQFTMRAPLYPDAFAPAGLTVIRPAADEQSLIHARYMSELVGGQFRPETREELMAIVRRLASRDGVDAVILGGTELSLLFAGAPETPVPFLDTAALHVDAILERMLSH